MARISRFAPPGYWLHITQRGHGRQNIFRHHEDRQQYLELLASYAEERQVQILGYCLMPDHVHLVALGKYPQAVAIWMKCLNGHFAKRMQLLQARQGRFWQGPYDSCVLDERHLPAALRYVELNPVRAGIVPLATRYKWSSAASHANQASSPNFLNHHEFARRYTATDWRQQLCEPQPESEVVALRRATKYGHPLGSPDFIARLEADYDVELPQSRFSTAGAAI